MSLSALELIVLAALVLLAGLAAGSIVTWLGMRNRQLQAAVDELKERIRFLERGGRKRMPHEVTEGLLDALAAFNRVRDEAQLNVEFLDNGMEHLKKVIQTGTKAGGVEPISRDPGAM